MKKLAFVPIVVAMAVMLLIYPENCLNSARLGLELWLTAVLPSLLPFMAASFLLLETGIVRLIAAVFAPVTRVLFFTPGESAYVLLASALSGYPVGARLAAELYAKGHMTEPDAQRTIRFTSVTGPVFITGAVSAGLLGLPEAGVYLSAAHYLSALLAGVLFGMYERRRGSVSSASSRCFNDAWLRFKHDAASCPTLGAILSSSVEKSIRALLKIGGFIILFSVILELLSVTGVMDVMVWAYSPLASLTGLDHAGAAALLSGSVEMTAGCARVAALATDINTKLVLASGIVSFGGFGIHMQTRAVCATSGLVPKKFLAAKSVQGAVSSALTALFLALFPISAAASAFAATTTKTAAFGGIIFAAAALVVLLLVKLWQRFSPSSSYPPAPAGSFEQALDNRQNRSPAQLRYRRHIPSRRS